MIQLVTISAAEKVKMRTVNIRAQVHIALENLNVGRKAGQGEPSV